MDTYLAITSRRDVKRYAARPLPDDVVRRILDAGRLAGSAGNRQPWRFLVVETREWVEALADCLWSPRNVLGASLVVAVAAQGFDLGRCAQNMMLAAWNEGVASCPNGIRDGERARELLGVPPDDALGIVLSFGYPARAREPASRPASEWSARAGRKPLAELVRRV